MALILVFAGQAPGGEGWPRGRSVRQAALLRRGEADGEELPSYRGDIVNGPEFTPRRASPTRSRQLQAYRQSAATLNFLRALLDGGYASLSNAHRWELKFMEGTPIEERYAALAREIERTVEVNRLLGITEDNSLGDADNQLLYQPRGPAARLRAGPDPARRGDGHGPARGHIGALPVDRRPHAPAGRRARGVLPRHRQPHRAQVRAVAAGGRALAADRYPRSRGTNRAGLR